MDYDAPELIKRIADKNPTLPEGLADRIDTVFDEISGAMAAGRRVEIRGFGAFSVRARDARLGRNPRKWRSCRSGGKTGAVF